MFIIFGTHGHKLTTATFTTREAAVNYMKIRLVQLFGRGAYGKYKSLYEIYEVKPNVKID